jgi:Predicted RNA binding protein (contains ribosomal protein S1 domain)
MPIVIGQIVAGKVTGITKFGVFLSLEEGKTGLVHISELSTSYVRDITEHVKENDVLTAKVISVDENGRISLSVKAVLEEQKNIRQPDDFYTLKKSGPANFEDMMHKFKQDSDEKSHDIKKSFESKRGHTIKKSSSKY